MTGSSSRIQIEKRGRILEAALEAFSQDGLKGVTLDRIANMAGLSKPNVVYYFKGKEAIYRALLDNLLEVWLEPLRQLDAKGEPVDEILAYVKRKLDLARDFPRESRLFANEIISGAPQLGAVLETDLRALVGDKAKVIEGWVEEGRIAPVNSYHLIMSIWALTQHYADFEAQVTSVLGPERDPWEEADAHLRESFLRMVSPPGALPDRRG